MMILNGNNYLLKSSLIGVEYMMTGNSSPFLRTAVYSVSVCISSFIILIIFAAALYRSHLISQSHFLLFPYPVRNDSSCSRPFGGFISCGLCTGCKAPDPQSCPFAPEHAPRVAPAVTTRPVNGPGISCRRSGSPPSRASG